MICKIAVPLIICLALAPATVVQAAEPTQQAAPLSAEKPAQKQVAKAKKKKRRGAKLDANAPDYARYCANIRDAATEARYARQQKKMMQLELELSKRIAMFESKQAELKKWLERREKFVARAQESLIAIYKTMRPDAAAQQLAMMDDMTAAAIILELDARSSSAIMNEFDPEQAARLAQVISGAAKSEEEEDGNS